MTQDKHLEEIFARIKNELSWAEKKFGGFASAHEGYGVILEELDELWHEIKNNKSVGSIRRMRDEAIQVAAMAVKFIATVCDTQGRVSSADAMDGNEADDKEGK
ncbi:MAG: hypothetical protein C4574_00565 [Candidatus Latescibacterota bacterium]|jgi:NTP pyrophosphatase (non-canonical NTP hydrolase)|nr:MAG: hypothetical protein C4574_00565 [Candidatus Latescibacterota bacterium]